MRLIDADALLDELRNMETSLARKGVYLVKGECNLYKIIKEQPIAYDVDKVMEELELLNPVDYGSMFSYEGHSCAREMKRDAIDIVEQGGIE